MVASCPGGPLYSPFLGLRVLLGVVHVEVRVTEVFLLTGLELGFLERKRSVENVL